MTELALRDNFSPAELQARIASIRDETHALQEFFKDVMVASKAGTAAGDYGIIPGTQRPTLLKPGAEKLAEFYGYAPTIKTLEETANEETGFYRVRVTLALVSKRTGVTMAEGVGEANTKEARHRWRDAKRVCPECGRDAIIKGKAEYGGGWLCFARKGGCGAKWDDGDAAIEKQEQGRVENDDPFSLWNTILKSAKKRALIDAVLSATRSSGLFTQDLEDLNGWVEGEVVRVVDERPAAEPEPARQPGRPAPPVGREVEPKAPTTPSAPLAASGPVTSIGDRGALTLETKDRLSALYKDTHASWDKPSFTRLYAQLNQTWPRAFQTNRITIVTLNEAEAKACIRFLHEQRAEPVPSDLLTPEEEDDGIWSKLDAAAEAEADASNRGEQPALPVS